MTARTALLTLFTIILMAMLLVTGWATSVQPVWEWGGLTSAPDHAWTIATLFDAYFGFITFFAWVCCKERRLGRRLIWFVALMLTGNMAMAVYVLIEALRLKPADSIDVLLTRRNS